MRRIESCDGAGNRREAIMRNEEDREEVANGADAQCAER